MFKHKKVAATLATAPSAQDTKDKRYRVRDRDWVKVWGEDLTFEEATKLKETVVGQRKSKTARVEDMAVKPPDSYAAATPASSPSDLVLADAAKIEPVTPLALGTPISIPVPAASASDLGLEDLELGDAGVPPVAPDAGMSGQISIEDLELGNAGAPPPPPVADAAPAPAEPVEAVQFSIDQAGVEVVAPKDGRLVRIPANCQLKVNGAFAQAPVSVKKGDLLVAEPQHPDLAAGQSAAKSVVAASLAGTTPRRRRVPPDRTVTPPAPRNRNPPVDKTVAAEIHVRLVPPVETPATPPESPQKAASEVDGKPLADDQLTDDLLPDVIGDIGGGPSDQDIAHAVKMRDAERKAGA